MPRLIVMINRKELEALVQLALSEIRNPRDQARYILRQNLIERRLLNEDCAASKPIETCKEELHV